MFLLSMRLRDRTHIDTIPVGSLDDPGYFFCDNFNNLNCEGCSSDNEDVQIKIASISWLHKEIMVSFVDSNLHELLRVMYVKSALRFGTN